jgi:hypothetical protein
MEEIGEAHGLALLIGESTTGAHFYAGGRPITQIAEQRLVVVETHGSYGARLGTKTAPITIVAVENHLPPAPD